MKIQTIYTQGICICTGSSQEIFLSGVRANTSGKMQLPQVIANTTTEIPRVKLVYTRGRRPKNRLRLRTRVKLVYTRGRRPKNCLRLRTPLSNISCLGPFKLSVYQTTSVGLSFFSVSDWRIREIIGLSNIGARPQSIRLLA